MHLDARRLDVLLSVFRAGSVTGAARSLHLSPSAVSQQIARLEREIEDDVMVRQSSGVTLTAVGRMLVESAERIEAELLDTRRSLAELTGQASGTVTIAAFRTITRSLFVPLVERLQERLPGVDVVIHQAEGEQGLQGLRSGLFDVLVIEADSADGRATPRGHRDIPLLDEPWLVLTPTSLPVPRTLDDLSELTWLGTAAGSATDLATKRVQASFADAPAVQHHFYDYDVAVAMVASGLGVALTPSLALPKPLPSTVRATVLPGLGVRPILVRHRASRTEPRREVSAVLREALSAAAELDLSAG